MADEQDGRWVTLHGARVFIANGQTVEQALEARKTSGSFKSSRGVEVKWRKVEPKEFKEALLRAKADVPLEKAWRVDDEHTVEQYKQDNCYIIGNGSTVAVTKQGDIISVCATKNDSKNLSGRDLMRFAVEHGGTKLDSYDGNHGFYVKCGFEPVSWVHFDEQYTKGWQRGRDNEQNVVFYKYTGKTTEESLKDFYAKVKSHSEYNDAYNARDEAMRRKP